MVDLYKNKNKISTSLVYEYIEDKKMFKKNKNEFKTKYQFLVKVDKM